MYFLTDVERKILRSKILPFTRQNPVEENLRGWNWHEEPVLPLHEDVKLPMYEVSSRYCPTGRDVYLRHIERAKPKYNFKIGLGKLIHGVVSDCLLAFIEGRDLSFEDWWRRIRWSEIPEGSPDKMRSYAEKVWDIVKKQCEARITEMASRQPYAHKRDILASAAPFLIEHKMEGSLLGLSDYISVDCYDYLHSIMFDLKIEFDKPQEWHKLTPTGYALVFESLHEVPVDVGGIVYVRFLKGGKIDIKKHLFPITSELRNEWIEERDQKLDIVAKERDPEKPSQPSDCYPDCVFYEWCWK